MPDKPSIAERLKALEKLFWDERYMETELAAIRAEIEAVAREMRGIEDGSYNSVDRWWLRRVDGWADRLAGEK